MITDLIKNYTTKERDDFYPLLHRDLDSHAEQNGKLERNEVSKIEDRVQCQRCSRSPRQGETCCTEEVKMQAEQRLSSRYIGYDLDTHELALRQNHKHKN